MIDHVSVGVRNLAASTALFEKALAALGHRKLVVREHTVGFGKQYPEFWLNHRPFLEPRAESGMHVCLRARSREQVEQFYRAALEEGARDGGPPGFRPAYHVSYFAAFIRDFDENSVEVVTFVDLAPTR